MKNKLKRIALIITLLIIGNSCQKEIPQPTITHQGPGGSGGGTGGGNSAGRVTFWNDDTSIGDITVYYRGTSATISHNIKPSTCNTSGCANFSGTPGTFAFSASSLTGETWSGYTTISSNGCLLFNLH